MKLPCPPTIPWIERQRQVKMEFFFSSIKISAWQKLCRQSSKKNWNLFEVGGRGELTVDLGTRYCNCSQPLVL